MTLSPDRTSLPPGVAWVSPPARIADPASRRVLLFTTTYPPRAAVGAARWESFTSYLRDAGWAVDVVMEQPARGEAVDRDRFSRLPPGGRILAIEQTNPLWHRLLIRARARFRRTERGEVHAVDAYSPKRGRALPGLRPLVDAAVHASRARSGARRMERAATALVALPPQVVVSSGPPHYVHVSAARVAARLRVPHVVDLRDPWGGHAGPSWSRLLFMDRELQRAEHSTLQRAALVITNTPAAERVLAERYPRLRDRICCIPNGSDLDPEEPSTHARPTCFRIAHCGSLYLDRDPRPFFRAVGRVRERLGLGEHDLRVTFMGPAAQVDGRPIAQLAAEAGLAGLFEERPPGPRDAARQLLRESSMAVAFQGETRTQVPAKIFEYVAFPVWVLALVGAESATADILAGTDAIVLDLDDEAGAERAIEACYRKFREGETARPAGWDGRFSRARQAERLIAALERIARDPSARSDAASAAQSLTRSSA